MKGPFTKRNKILSKIIGWVTPESKKPFTYVRTYYDADGRTVAVTGKRFNKMLNKLKRMGKK